MKLSTNILAQSVALIAQLFNQVGGVVPAKYQVPIALGIGVAQSIMAFVAHFTNPDGTSASTAYVKPPQQGV